MSEGKLIDLFFKIKIRDWRGNRWRVFRMRGKVHRWRLLRMEEKANVEGIQGRRRGYGGGYLELKEGVKEDGEKE